MGGTKIEGLAINAEGKEIFRQRIDTQQEGGYEHILQRIRDLYRTLVSEIQNHPHTLGMGTPGAFSHLTGRMKNSNTLCFNDRLTYEEISTRLGRPLRIENDANCFALAETIAGAGQGSRLVFGVIMGTGCGGGIVMDGQIWTGKQSIAGEWGHTVLDPRGPLCYCGRCGCVETFISGGGLEDRYKNLHHEKIKLPEILRRFRNDEEPAKPFMMEFFCHFGRALANVINLLDPDVVVLGGGVSNIEELYRLGIQEVRKNVFNDTLETPILKHALGDSTGVLGAALIGI